MDEELYSVVQRYELHRELRVRYLIIMAYNYLILIQFSPIEYEQNPVIYACQNVELQWIIQFLMLRWE